MQPIHKKILTDEAQNPLAVQIDYADWLTLEKLLQSLPSNGAPAPAQTPTQPAPDLNRFAGRLKLSDDPLASQQRSRDEW